MWKFGSICRKADCVLNIVQKAGWGLGALMLVERLWKQSAITAFFRQAPPPPAPSPPQLVSIIQPVLSGDPTMPACLEANLYLKCASALEYIWVVDEDDEEGCRICQELKTRYPEVDIRLVTVPPPLDGYNPKSFKLIEGRKVARGEIICVLDDDTMLPENGLEVTLPYLDQPGIGLAFGLPYYVNFSNGWSSMVSTFVNSNSLLTYIPYTALTQPFTINGMYYVIRSSVLDSMGGFEAIKHMFSDDFAIAHLCRTHGYFLAQTPVCHGISTQVRDRNHYFNLLQRWFVFPRESILRYVSPRDRLLVYLFGIAPILFPLFLVLALLFRPSWSKLIYTLLYFGCNLAIVDEFNKKYLRSARPAHKVWLIPVMLVLIPIQIICSLALPQRANWRGNVVQVEPGGGFRYIRRRSVSVKV
jgi:ceramide glucosyltransferase